MTARVEPVPDIVGKVVFDLELEQCQRSWEGGNYPALADAVRLCRKFGQLQPDWVHNAILSELEKAQSDSSKKRNIENYYHWLRWDKVCEIRDLKSQLGITRFDSKLGENSIFDVVAKILEAEKSPARAMEETVRKSYNIVEKAKKRGETTFVFTRSRPL